jgi:hypothetical protein
VDLQLLNLHELQVLTYVSVSAQKIGLSQSFSFYFVAIANAASLFGRLAAGLLSDRYGMTFIFCQLQCQFNCCILRPGQHHDSVYRYCRHPDVRLALCPNEVIAHCDCCPLRVSSLVLRNPSYTILNNIAASRLAYIYRWAPTRRWRLERRAIWAPGLGCSCPSSHLVLSSAHRYLALSTPAREASMLLGIMQVHD